MARGPKTRGNRQNSSSGTPLVVPDKLFFRIGEVSDLADTKPYVLRYWETEFPMLKPVKSPTGHRLYRRQDVEMVLRIKQLLYEEGFTIEGARKHLSGSSDEPQEARAPAGNRRLDGAPLKTIERELQAILTMLSRKC
jgi:DNA-binding transcriptional MerR regulator